MRVRRVRALGRASIASASRRSRGATDRMAVEPALPYAWLRHWAFWLTVTLAAFLRLWHVELTQFLQDQAHLFGLASAAIQHGALPLTSNISSVGTYHPPLSLYLLMPFAALTDDPLPAVVAIALLNVAAVALTYVFALRTFGRSVAAWAALLFAVSNPLVNYSRFIWQPNYTAPVTLLAMMALYRGAADGRRNWLAVGTVLVLADALIHPANVLLVPTVVGALLIAPSPAGLRAWLVAGAAALTLLLPTIAFEVMSGGADLHAYLHPAGGAVTNMQVLRALGALLGGLGPLAGGQAAAYDQLIRFSPPLDGAAMLLFMLGAAVLTWEVARPVVSGWQRTRDGGAARDVRARLPALWRAPRTRGRAQWRAYLLLWLWVLAPLPLLLRHSEPVTQHYLLFLAPGIFIVQALAVPRLAGWLRAAADLIARRTRAPGPQRPGHAAAAAVFALAGLLVAGQTVRWALYPAALAAGQFDAYGGYGFPLAGVQMVNERLQRLQSEQGATAVYVITPEDGRYADAYDALFSRGRPDRVTFARDCLVLPTPGAGPALVVATEPRSPAGDLLTALPSARHIADIAVSGGSPFAVYRVGGSVPRLGDEQTLSPITFADTAGNSLRLDGLATSGSGVARLRWTVPGAATRGTATPVYRIALQSETPGAGAETEVVCRPTRLHPGQTLFTWLPLPSATRGAGNTPLTLRVLRGTADLDLRVLGPLRVITARAAGVAPTPLPFQTAASPATGDTAYPLPAGVVSDGP